MEYLSAADISHIAKTNKQNALDKYALGAYYQQNQLNHSKSWKKTYLRWLIVGLFLATNNAGANISVNAADSK